MGLLAVSHLFKEYRAISYTTKTNCLSNFFTWLINGVAEGFGGITGRILELKHLVFLGKISYGTYLYHYFMSPILSKAYELKLLAPLPMPIEVLLKCVLTLAIAIPSWFFIEKPINNLKKYFSYKKASDKVN